MLITYSCKKIFKFLLILFGVLLICNIGVIYLKFSYSNATSKILYDALSFNSEISLPTLYSTVLLLTAAFLLYIIYHGTRHNSSNTKKFISSWLFLSLVFLFLTVDEAIAIHEKFTGIVRDKLQLSGLLYFGWVVPYSAFLLLFFIVIIPFLIKLEKVTRNLFILSGAIFVSGAIGIELLEGKHHELYGRDFSFAVLYTIEESLEMIGVSIFIFALLRYLSIISPKSVIVSS